MTAARVSPFALIALLAAGALAADEPRRPGDGSQLVVMSDGRILEGTVTRQATGYYVERHSGRVVVPFEQVRCVARDLSDAYRQQREAMLDPTAADLIKLAEWCISYRLYDEARVELHRALRRDATNDTARRMLSRVEDTLLAKPPPPKPPLSITDGLVAPEVESLGGFSRPTAAQFTARVQPLLMHRCGNASCHGTAAQNDFRLTQVRLEGHSQRRGTEQNLAQVLKYVDFQQPQHSELLDRLRGGHGGGTRAIFAGAQGSEQQKLLRDWVNTVARERREEDAKLAQRPKLGKQPAVATASAIIEEPAAPKAVDAMAIEPAEAVKVPPLKSLPPRGADAFDPEEFNRRFGGTSRR